MSGETMHNPSDRRPIAQRERRWAKAINGVLVRSPLTPNQISVIGMLAAIGAGVAAACTGGDRVGDGGDRVLWALVAVFVIFGVRPMIVPVMRVRPGSFSSCVSFSLSRVMFCVMESTRILAFGFSAASFASAVPVCVSFGPLPMTYP